MKVEADNLLDPSVGNDIDRQLPGWRAGAKPLGMTLANQQRLDRQPAGQKPDHQLLPFGHEPLGPTRGVGLLQVAIGDQPRIVE